MTAPGPGGRRPDIYVENAEILAHQALEAGQRMLRVRAGDIASTARPGQFAHIRCDASLPMRRPMSIMRVDPQQGWVEFLYKQVGLGTRMLAQKAPGSVLSLLGPIGVAFEPVAARPRALLIGGGVGIPPMVFLADRLRRDRHRYRPFVLMGSEIPFPFPAAPSRIAIPGLPDGTIASVPLMEDWGIPSRLASGQGFPGCFEGHVSELAEAWLGTLRPEALAEVAVYACGPTPMLAATARLSRRFEIPCQVSLEEYMACAVGGCAGCAVLVQTPAGRAMKRVCVDGPVFDARHVVWP